jgi:D-glycero-alpha-D-manno-heptose-7-phosphate kinase
MSRTERPQAVIKSVAPIRICDNGSWTDTWFAGHGEVFNVAVSPLAEVEVAVYPARDGEPRVLLHPRNFGERYEVRHGGMPWGPHPLLEAAIASMDVPCDMRLEVTVHSDVPPGASTGTSAAVTVALLGALDALTPGRLTPLEVARAAHRVETEKLGRQCGIQDQIASAFGGICFIEMPEYPRAAVTRVEVEDRIRDELEQRLLLVYLGKSHDSSAIHEAVIRSLEDAGPDSPALVELRSKARESRDALVAGDFTALGRVMRESTEAQRRLHDALLGADARRVIDLARAHDVLGWKVNGAGGEGGSLTLLGAGGSEEKSGLAREIEACSEAFRIIPIRLDRDGLRVSRRDLRS